jgi:riboflavin-specific deaminase-like protein
VADLAIGHVGQSLDGYIAADSGESRFVTGPADVEHTHRLRALFDAVLVGRSTVANDDPELTTRLVAGEHATRVVVDPGRRLRGAHRVLSDRKARTLLVCGEAAARQPSPPHVELVAVRSDGDRLCPRDIRAALGRLGLRRIFVEGGGVTLSRFLEAGALDRAHVAVSPVLIGSGRRGLSVPAAPTLGEAWRPRFRRFLLGDDVLYDFDLRSATPVRGLGAPRS